MRRRFRSFGLRAVLYAERVVSGLLAHYGKRPIGRSNYQTLFGIGRIPSDNYICDFLDKADPALLQPCFERMEALQSKPPMRQAFGQVVLELHIEHPVHALDAPMAARSGGEPFDVERRGRNVEPRVECASVGVFGAIEYVKH